MHARLAAFLLAVGLPAVLIAQSPPGQPGGAGAGQPGGSGDRPGVMTTSLDGTWTVVSAARDGKAVDGADKMTVTVKGNVVTFAGGAGGGDKAGGMRALRLDFGPGGTVRVTEAAADGRFGGTGAGSDTGTGSGTGTTTRPGDTGAGTTRPGGTGTGTGTTQPGGTGASDRPGGTGMTGSLSGVYVMTPDYLAIAVTDATGMSGSGSGAASPGGTGTTTRPGDTGTTRPGGTGTGTTRPGGTDTTPGGAGTTRPGGADATQPGGTGSGATAGSGMPQMRSHLSVVLRRSGGAGAGGGDRP